MKKTLLLLSMVSGLLFSGKSFAGGGPDNFGYTWLDSNDPGGPTYNWIDIKAKTGATQVKLLSDDNTKGPFSIPFNFHYYWYDVKQFWVGSNGYVIFNNGQMSHPFPAIPSSAQPNDFLAVMECDLNFDGATNTGECYYWFNAAKDTLIVSWLNAPFYDSVDPNQYQGSNSFQVIMSTVDSSITYQYLDQQGSYMNASNFMTIGIENVSGNVGLQHSYGTYPQTSYAIKYYYPRNTSYQVKDAATMWSDNQESGALFLPWKGANRTLTAGIKNTGNVKLMPFNVNGKVIKGAASLVVTSTMSSDTLDPAASQQLSFQNKFTPSSPGSYKFITTTQLAGDMVSSNNSMTQEILVVDTTPNSMILGYTDNTSEGQGLSWTGGNGGAGIYIKPPFYPVKVTKLRFFIVGNMLASTFDGKVFDDDGINGSAGTMIDSVRPANPPADGTGAWEEVTLNNPFYVNSGGFYVSWMMDGSNIMLGQDQTAPFSNRTYEVLGNSWAIYRTRESEDLMISAVVERGSMVGINENSSDNSIGDFYPNPSSTQVSLNYTLDKNSNVQVKLIDIQGRIISNEMFKSQAAGNNKLDIQVENLNAGMYFCEISTNGKVATKKFTVVK